MPAIITWVLAHFPTQILLELALKILQRLTTDQRILVARRELAEDMAEEVIDAIDTLVQRADVAFADWLGGEKAAWVMGVLNSDQVRDYIDDPTLPGKIADTAMNLRNAALELAVRGLKSAEVAS